MRIDVVEFGGREQRGDRRPGPATSIGSGEERVLARDSLRADRALHGVVIDINTTIVKEAFERGAPPHSIADRFGQFGLARDALELGLPALEQFGHDRGGGCTTREETSLGCVAADVLFDMPEGGHALDRPGGGGRQAGNMEFVEVPPEMRPTGGERHGSTGAVGIGEPCVGAIAITLQQSRETFEVMSGAFAAAAVFKAVGHQRRGRCQCAVVELPPAPSGTTQALRPFSIALLWPIRQLCGAMDHERVTAFTELLISCHGMEAENVARKRAAKCMKRGETEWAELYQAVAGEIAKRQRLPSI
jgi:hypothetical protein